MKPLCFVLMPFGRKPDGTGRVIDFDAVYQQVIAPAVAAADMDGIRADEEQIGGTIHKPMFERLMLCDFAVADVTGANPNVYYELGIRHALRPSSTVILFAAGTALPFDLASQRGTPYDLDATGAPSNAGEDSKRVADRLRHANEESHDDSPLFQLVDGMPRLDLEHMKTDVFRDRVEFSQEYKSRLAVARKSGIAAVQSVAADPRLASLRNVEAGVIIDLLLSFRALGKPEGYEEMVKLYQRMPRPLQQARMVREQIGFAYGRLKKFDEAERMLAEIIKEFGQNAETNGLLGRIYKDRWDAARKAGRASEARGHLKRAIETYRAGFETDWRDPYPGINAVTLMEMLDRPDPAQADLLPVVRYAAKQRAQTKGERTGDYWDHATMLELAVLARDADGARDAADAALAVVREPWEPETTARNLGLIRETRQARGEDAGWVAEIEADLAAAQESLQNPKPASAG
jgi:tetratricopeptide (TPR) repeat protein